MARATLMLCFPFVSLFGSSSSVTNEFGHPIPQYETSATLGNRGFIPLVDTQLLNKLAHFGGERTPERVVHAKGAGARGTFEVTHDVSEYCAAQVFELGRKTPVLARFSTVGGERGSADTARDPRGFAVKHYSGQGIWDFVGNNTPVFFIRDGMLFPDFIHTQKRNPISNLKDPEAFWDFFVHHPESQHQVMILFTDKGTPDGYRHMNGYSGHAFKAINADGEAHYIKMHYISDQGIKNLTDIAASVLSATDPDYATRDLFEAIEAGDHPSWSLYWQVMPPADVEKHEWDVLDVTKAWPKSDYPLLPVGRLTLDENPKDFFNDVEQAAFSPGNLPPGLLPSEDLMLQARIFAYPDTQRHRLGRNYSQLPVNCPFRKRTISYRDGASNVAASSPDSNYYTSSAFGEEGSECEAVSCPYVGRSEGMLHRYERSITDADFVQPRELYRNGLSEDERFNLIANISNHLDRAALHTQREMIKLFLKVDYEYGFRIAQNLFVDVTSLDLYD